MMQAEPHRGWALPFGAMCFIQAIGPLMMAVLPVAAPMVTAASGMPPQAIGAAASAQGIGSLVALALVKPVIDWMGPVRAIQAGTVLSALGVALIATAQWPLVMLGAFLIGAGYGPMPPASNSIIFQTVPGGIRSMLFSIKQATSPIGMVTAGLTIPFLMAVTLDWRSGIWAVAALSAFAAVLLQPLRLRFDKDEIAARPDKQGAGLWQSLLLPFRLLARGEVALLSLIGFCFTAVLGAVSAFAVTYLVGAHGMSPAAAAGLYAIMHITSMPSRVFAGWFSDQINSGRGTLLFLHLGSMGVLVTLAMMPGDAGYLTLAVTFCLAGFFQAGWNGVIINEIATSVAPREVSDVSASTAAIMFFGYGVGPLVFGALSAASGGYAFAFAVFAAVPFIAAILLVILMRVVRARQAATMARASAV